MRILPLSVFICVHLWFLFLCVNGIGCASAVSAGTNTSLSADDLTAMTDRMAMSIVAAPGVQEAIAREGKLRVVIQPVENYMSGEILPAGQKRAFVTRVRELLAGGGTRDRFVWIMNKADFYAVRGSELETHDLGPSPDSMQPTHELTARFDSLTNVTSSARSSGYLCAYRLVDLRTREVVWADKYEVRKTAVRGFLD